MTDIDHPRSFSPRAAAHFRLAGAVRERGAEGPLRSALNFTRQRPIRPLCILSRPLDLVR